MATTFSAPALEGIEIPAPGTYRFDPDHTEIGAIARHLMVTKVRGLFHRFEGAIHIEEDPLRSWVEVEIDASSIDTRVNGRDEHLRSADFLDVENHPAITFRSTSFARTGDRTFDLHGDLTIRGVTKPITLKASYEGQTLDEGQTRLFFSAAGELDREAFGMTWNQALETGGVMVSKVLKLSIEVSALSS